MAPESRVGKFDDAAFAGVALAFDAQKRGSLEEREKNAMIALAGGIADEEQFQQILDDVRPKSLRAQVEAAIRPHLKFDV